MDPSQVAEFLANSNECFDINLTRPSSDSGEPERILEEPFNPAFTYPIYGEEETIVGYKDLQIELDFRANDLKPSLDVRYFSKWDALPADKATNPKEALKGWLPDYVFDSAMTPKCAGPDPTSSAWKPPGKLVKEYVLHGKRFEIWQSSLADPAAKQIFKNMQILVPLFIEGGSLLDLDDQDWTVERWTVFLLYEVTPLKDTSVSPYTIAGFSTSYRLWVFPTFDILRATNALPSPPVSSNGDAPASDPIRFPQDSETYLYKDALDPLEAPSRERISQFVILPPYQGQSLGAKLYETMFDIFVKIPNIFEITVEDPNEAFDDMRDFSDIAFLRRQPAFQALALPSTLPPETLRRDTAIPMDLILGSDAKLDALRHDSKIVPRQFNRMVEIHLLSTIPSLHRNKARITRKEKSSNENDRKYYFWRLALKHRLYLQNEDQLSQIEQDERVEKLDLTADSVQSDYERLLDGVDSRSKWASDEQNGVSKPLAKRKRAIIEDDEDDDWEDVEESASSSKKSRR